MKNKILLLAALLALQLVAAVLLHVPARDGKKNEALIPGLTLQQLQRLSISDRDGKTLTLEKEKSTGNWEITAPAPPLPADNDKIKALVTKLAALTSERLVAKSAGAHPRLEVADELFQRRIELFSDQGRSKTILFGTQPGFQLVHTRVQGEAQVYLSRGIAAWDIATDKWLWWREHYPGINTDSIVAIGLKNGHGSFNLSKQGDKWLAALPASPPGANPAPLDDGRLQQLLRSVDLRVEEYLGREKKKEFGLERPAVVLELTRAAASGQPAKITVLLGTAHGSTGRHVAKASNSPLYVALTTTTARPLLDATLTGLRITDKKPTKAAGR